MVPVFTACLFLAGCSDDNEDVGNVNVEALLTLVAAAGITGDPTTGRTLPVIEDAKAQLGKKLFFTKGLGGINDSACVTCHHPTLGGGDNLSLPIGVGAETPDLLGPGRFHDSAVVADDGGVYDGGPTVPRNAPTTFNIGLWDQALFHDGRVESLGKTVGVNGDDGLGIRTPDSAFGVADPDSGTTLAAAQARFPVTSHEEMRGFTFEFGNTNAALRTALEAKLTVFSGWDAEFTAAFGDPAITYGRIAEAIGEYERSQVFVDNPWKDFVEGNEDAIVESAKRGAMLFFNTLEDGGANCASCHSGDFFTDESFHVLAMPQIGRGKGDDNGTLTNDDFGRARETGDDADRYKFRTPTLLNVEVTGPWGHAGGYTTLAEVVRHMLNPNDAISTYNFSLLNPTIQASDMLTNTQFALTQLETNRTNNVNKVHQDVAFTDDNVVDLVEFLRTLTDPCVIDRACLAPWIPDAADTNPDGLRLNAIDNNGEFL
ncbi:MAG: cytochrome-c peroxidase [Thiotrichaceae bacterium]|nr:MAG: cytochrome-c peroxidase [Thiotrichaceae bacterium]